MTDPQPTPPDTNQIIEERRGKLAALRNSWRRVPERLRSSSLRGRPAAAVRRRDQRGARSAARARDRSRPAHAEARDGQGELCHTAGHDRAHPGVRADRCGRRGGPRSFQALGPGRHSRRRRHAVSDPDRRADREGAVDQAAREVAAAAAGEVPRARRPGAEVPPALRRPDHEPRLRARCSRGARASSRRCAIFCWRGASSKSRRR